MDNIDLKRIRSIIDGMETGYAGPEKIREILGCAGIDVANQYIGNDPEELLFAACSIVYPIVAKAVGPIHKSDTGGVALNIRSEKLLLAEIERLLALPGTHSVMLQPMIKGKELFLGAKYEPKFGHVVLCGLGGIFVEILEDISSGLAPLTFDEAYSMIRSLKSYKIIKGTRGQKGIDQDRFADIMVRLSTVLRYATEIKEMDLNPLIATEHSIQVVDSRMYVEK
jgi:acetyltransferase